MKKLRRLFRFVIGKFLVLARTLLKFLIATIRWIHSRKRYAIPFYTLVAYVFFIFLLIKLSGDPGYEKVILNKRVNDVTTINPIQVGREIQPQTIEEIVDAIRNSNGPISIGGGRFSMGGQ